MNIYEHLVVLLNEQKKVISIAESCTGGMLASKIVDVPGSSHIFETGIVTYSERSKVENLGVNPNVIKHFGVVSFEVACAMARGLYDKTKSDYAIAVTGYAGPGNDKEKAPVGTVYFSIEDGENNYQYHVHFEGERNQVRERACEFIVKKLVELLQK